jgi:hypothetical protein
VELECEKIGTEGIGEGTVLDFGKLLRDMDLK